MELQTAMYETITGENMLEEVDNSNSLYFDVKTEGKKLKKAILRSQRCQRNWDLTKQLSEEQLELVLHAATECPTKQNIPVYSVKVIQDRKMIEAIYEWTYGPAPSDTPTEKKGKWNPQVLANTLLVFTEHDFSTDIGSDRSPETSRPKELRTDEDNRYIHDDVMQAVGVAAGYVNLTSTMLGLQTGCCKCMIPQEIQKIIGGNEKPLLLMGVGFGKKDAPRRVHQTSGQVMPSYNKRIAVEIIK